MQLLLLRPVPGRDQKRPDVNVGDLAPGRKIGLMPDEHTTGIRIAGKQPPISVGGAAVNFSGSDSHGDFPK
jgi:hypothetical protein